MPDIPHIVSVGGVGGENGEGVEGLGEPIVDDPVVWVWARTAPEVIVCRAFAKLDNLATTTQQQSHLILKPQSVPGAR